MQLVSWVAQTIERLGDHSSDNTLPGAQSKEKEFAGYKNGEKPPKSAEKTAVLTLHKNISQKLEKSSHHRPAFAPAEGHTPNDINAQWEKLEEAEKSRDDWLKSELQRFYILVLVALIVLQPREA